MKVLVLGNSQAGALKRSHDRRAEALAEAGLSLHFHVIPGGMGPDVHVVDDRIVVGATSAASPPYAWPPGTPEMPVSGFDAILISALGYTDGGFAFKNPLTTLAALAEYGPRGGALAREIVSDRCYGAIATAIYDAQAGFIALRAVTAAFAGPVLVQPFPRPSEALLDHPDWQIGQWYADAPGMHRFLEGLKDGYLARIAAETGARILPHAAGDADRLFTPSALMNPADGVHQGAGLADLVLDQLVAGLALAGS